ncbi:MAG: YicC/YloC family endoribonuclease, partial [Clostridiales bacterium]
MIKSMTGYGRGEAENENYHLIVETKAVNHRFLEVALRLPKQLNPLEDMIRKTIQSSLNRGRIDVFITLEESGQKKYSLKVDNDLALVYHKSLLQVGELCQ